MADFRAEVAQHILGFAVPMELEQLRAEVAELRQDRKQLLEAVAYILLMWERGSIDAVRNFPHSLSYIMTSDLAHLFREYDLEAAMLGLVQEYALDRRLIPFVHELRDVTMEPAAENESETLEDAEASISDDEFSD